jgi:hypothetical protein
MENSYKQCGTVNGERKARSDRTTPFTAQRQLVEDFHGTIINITLIGLFRGTIKDRKRSCVTLKRLQTLTKSRSH